MKQVNVKFKLPEDSHAIMKMEAARLRAALKHFLAAVIVEYAKKIKK